MRIATRGSPMARAQTAEVIRQLKATSPDVAHDEVLFETTGDRRNAARLSAIGGKGGAFVAELRQKIRDGDLDAAMHSLKDIPGNEETPGLTLGAFLRRDSAADCLVLRAGVTEEDLKRPSTRGRLKIGTSSARRRAFLTKLYPHCEVIHFRGSVTGSEKSRLHKLDHQVAQQLEDGSEVGPADALVLAASGLHRLGLADRIAREYTFDEVLPAVGQGTVTVECRADDFANLRLLDAINHAETRQCSLAERELLWILNGHCNSPIAGVCTIEAGELVLRAAVMSVDGASTIGAQRSGPIEVPRELGRAVAFELLEKGARTLIEAAR
jgi:hydroxymethylbilane synthase